MPRASGPSHEWDICRALYATARKAGAPAVQITDMGDDFLFAETSDGLASKSEAKGCCRWAMKYEVAEEWRTRHGLKVASI